MDHGHDQHPFAVSGVAVDDTIVINDYFSVGKMREFKYLSAGFRSVAGVPLIDRFFLPGAWRTDGNRAQCSHKYLPSPRLRHRPISVPPFFRQPFHGFIVGKGSAFLNGLITRLDFLKKVETIHDFLNIHAIGKFLNKGFQFCLRDIHKVISRHVLSCFSLTISQSPDCRKCSCDLVTSGGTQRGVKGSGYSEVWKFESSGAEGFGGGGVRAGGQHKNN
jgi:hypothetical protein